MLPRDWLRGVSRLFLPFGAEREAARLAIDHDVYVGGAAAYSTLGWFDDPVLSTFIRYDAAALADLLFHELAHGVVYVRGDSAFNEAFATFVGNAGALRWLGEGSAGPMPTPAASRPSAPSRATWPTGAGS